MTTELQEVLSKVDTLSEEELKAVQKHISEKLEQKDTTTNEASANGNKPEPHLTIGYRLSSQELKELLFSFLTPEELAELDKKEPTGELPTLPRPIQEYIDEDREDRL